MDLADIQDIYPTAAEYTFSSNTHRKFSMIDNMLGHKTSLKKFEKTEIYKTSFPTTML